MDRRGFIKGLGWGLAAAWVWGPWGWPRRSIAAGPALRLALLADAHLKDGDDRRPEAKALARAVAEMRVLKPSPDLVLLAGDLAHQGRPEAMDLGEEILADLPAPVWAVRGEGDYGRHGAAAWGRRFGEPRFSRTFQGVHLVGLDTTLAATPAGPVFEVGAAQRRWLAGELAEIDPAAPLVIVSHAPLPQIFQPWQQWTADAGEIAPLFSSFRRVLCLHGHVHGTGIWGQGSGARNADYDGNSSIDWSVTENPLHLSLPATAWPHPHALQGTPAVFRPGQGPCGCGWTLLTLSPTGTRFLPQVWQA
ncbi:MAG: metallophosphoesterase [Syntrophobacterales bacterium]|jgi:3',5'-cyclic AMP phosphodiesterase CpdA|nr:metallophosphoesterase [Syntrophobacterales bacterium]